MDSTTEVPKTCKVVTAETVAKSLLEEVRSQKGTDSKPYLAAFLANDDPAALQYAQWSKKTCEEKCVLSFYSCCDSKSRPGTSIDRLAGGTVGLNSTCDRLERMRWRRISSLPMRMPR